MRRTNLIALSSFLVVAAVGATIGGVSATKDDGGSARKHHKPKPSKSDSRKPRIAAAQRVGPAELAEEVDAVDDTAPTTAGSAWRPGENLTNLHGKRTQCGSQMSGSSDDAGNIYHGCRKGEIHVRRANGDLIEYVHTHEPADNPATATKGDRVEVGARDVAASPDGLFIYYSVGPRKDQPSAAEVKAHVTGIHRMKLTIVSGKRVWKRDKAFVVDAPNFGGSDGPKNYWNTRYITVGHDGTVYASVNAYIYAWDANGGRLADYTGQYASAASTTPIGPAIAGYPTAGPINEFRVVEGLAMSTDDTHLYAVDETQEVVARFARTGGAWAVDKLIGTVGVAGTCAKDGKWNAPYDVATTATQVLVTDTTCGRIRSFDQDLNEGETMLQLAKGKPHGIAAGKAGTVVLPYRNRMWRTK